MSGFISELKRRNVIRMAGLYLVGAWLITQVAGTVLPMFGAPEWIARSVVILLAIGFIPALVFAWIFELTPEGLKRDADVPEAQSIAPQTARKMERSILVLFAIALIFFGFDKFYLAPKREAALITEAVQASKNAKPAITDKSIAVLPFVDMSQSKDQEWFGDGLAEEILNALAKTPDLQVSARTSSFKYKASNLAVPQIAKELGVAHVLEGSIRSTPTRIRVTAQLIRASDGFHLRSQTYDRDPADMIAIQEDLAKNIATVMQTTMDPKAMAEMADVGTRSVEAYQAYIRGVAGVGKDVPADVKEGYAWFEKARVLDPDFAAAHAQAADFWLTQLDTTRISSGLTDASPEQAAKNFSERIDLAIAHAASSTDALQYRALKARRELRLREAIELSRKVLAERPGDARVFLRLLEAAGYASDHDLGAELLDGTWPQALLREDFAVPHANNAYVHFAKAKAADRGLELLERWPDRPAIVYQIHRALLWDRRVEQAGVALARWKSIVGPDEAWSALPPARQACAEGRRGEVEAALDKIAVTDISQRWHLLMMLGRTDEVVALLQPFERAGNTYALAGYLAYPEFDPSPFPSLMRILEREKIKRPPPAPLPFACPPARKGAG